MRARILYGLFLVGAACSSDPTTSPPPDGAPPDGVAARAEALRDGALGQRLEGASFETIAETLRGEPGVVEALASDSGLVFVLEGAAPTWIHAPPERAAISRAALTGTSTRGDSLVIRPQDRVERADDKTALILDPFYWQFGVDLAPRVPQIEALRDWRDARIVRNAFSFDENVSDADFTGWNDHAFVWVSTHGDRLPKSNPKYTILFNSVLCGAAGWARQTSLLNLDNFPGERRSALLGLSEGQMRARLSPDEQRVLGDYLAEERRRFTAAGKTCQVMEHTVDGAKQFLYWTAYDKAWFDAQPRLSNTVLLLSACSSDSLPLRIDEAKATVFGWSQPVAVEDDARTLSAFFRLMFDEGYTPQGLEDELVRRGLERSMFSAQDALFKFEGTPEARLRESVHVIDPETGRPVEGRASFPTREVTAAGDTLVDMDVTLLGLEDRRPDQFELLFERPDGTLLGRLTPVPRRDVDGVARATLEVTLPFDVRQSPGPHDLVAKLLLPEDETGRGGRAFGVHAFEAVFEPPVDRQWSVRGTGVNVSGDAIRATSVRAVRNDDGVLVWALQLGQSDASPIPSGTVAILGHPGRNPDCTGDTGEFEATFAMRYSSAEDGLLANDPEEPLCPGLTANISSFEREDGLVAEIRGTACRPQLDMMGQLVPEPVPITLDLSWPAAGCGAEMPGPGEGFIGSYRANAEPNLCQDVYQNADIASAFEAICAMSGAEITCSDDPCPRMNVLGTCDARSASAQSLLRGAIWVYYNGFDAAAADLEVACTAQGGTWTTGM